MPRRIRTHRPRCKIGIEHGPSPEVRRARQLRSGKEWQQCAREGLEAEPWCCDPYHRHKRHDERVPATLRHHVIAVAKAPELYLEPSNHRSLCASCHALIEHAENRGEDTAKLF